MNLNFTIEMKDEYKNYINVSDVMLRKSFDYHYVHFINTRFRKFLIKNQRFLDWEINLYF